MLVQLILIIVGTILFIILGIFIMIGFSHKKVPQGQALVRTGFGGAKVAYDSGIFVIPALHRLEKLDMTLKRIEVKFSDRKPLYFKNHKMANYTAYFIIRVSKDKKSIVEVAQTFGCERTYDFDELNALFQPIFASAVKKVAREFDADQIQEQLDQFEMRILERIGTDLNGYVLDQVISDHLEVRE
jgi:flotillin